MSANHDIVSNQGETLNLHILYTDSDDSGIDLTSYVAEMNVRRSVSSSNKLLHLYSGTTVGITAGLTGHGDTGGMTGGIFLNRNVGNSGSQTGGILLIAGSTATGWIPDGSHHYDMEIKYTPTGETTRIIKGRFDSDGEVTR